MAITVVKDVVEYNAARNPIRYGVECSNFDPGTAVAPFLAIYFDSSDLPANGDTITLDSIVLGGPVEFTFATSPAYSPDELPAYVAGTVADYCIALSNALQAKYNINTYYRCAATQVGPLYGILIIGRNLSQEVGGALYTNDQDLTWSSVGWTEDSDSNGNANSFTLPANAAVIFQLHADIDYPNNAVRIIIEDEYPPDDEGRAYIRVEKALFSLLTATFPAANSGTAVTAWKSMTKWSIQSAERYGDPIETYPMTVSDEVFAYLAGRRELNRAQFPEYEDQVIGLSTAVKFLTIWANTSAAAEKSVVPEQREYLSWIFPSDRGDTFILRADLYYETGADTIGHIIETFVDRYNELLLCPVGPDLIALEAVDPTRRLRGYRIYLTNSGSVVRSEYRYYSIDYRYHEHLVQLVYWTSSGGLDTLLLTGAGENGIMVDMDRSTRVVVDPTTSIATNDAVAVLQTTYPMVEQSTQYLREDELLALADLFGSEFVRIPSGASWIPVELMSKAEADLSQDGEGKQSLPIRYRLAVSNTANR